MKRESMKKKGQVKNFRDRDKVYRIIKLTFGIP